MFLFIGLIHPNKQLAIQVGNNQSLQLADEDILCMHCHNQSCDAFANWHDLLPSSQDNLTSWHLFHLVHVNSEAFQKLKENLYISLRRHSISRGKW